jgi:deferrochelatase/peroxidase EfeB
MSDERKNGLSRRSLFAVTAAVGSTIGLAGPAAALPATAGDAGRAARDAVAFHGPHQAGIVTDQQSHTYMATFDVTATKRADLVALLKTWTAAAERLTSGLPVAPATAGYDPAATLFDSGETVGLAPARLTLTFGLGPDLFLKDGTDRFGLASMKPDALVTLPRFVGDKLIDAKTGGDLSVQACADDPQVAFHAVRQLARLVSGAADIRWVQAGFTTTPDAKATPRNLMGFKDGTQTVTDLNRFVWAGNEAPHWMQGGSYLVVRRIRIALEHWDQMKLAFQEQTIGRSKTSGAPIGMKHESDALPLAATDANGDPVIAENAHVRLANESTNGGAQILRRGYSYNDGVDFTTERWPPWRQAMEFDAGLLFVSYQRDPRTSFIPMFEKLSRFDMLNQFVTHTGSGIFAVPRGVQPGSYIGQELVERA